MPEQRQFAPFDPNEDWRMIPKEYQREFAPYEPEEKVTRQFAEYNPTEQYMGLAPQPQQRQFAPLPYNPFSQSDEEAIWQEIRNDYYRRKAIAPMVEEEKIQKIIENWH